MIPNFPRPFPDELVYSLIARYGWLEQTGSLKTMAKQVFATENALAIVGLPSRLGALCAAIGDQSGLDVQTLIRNHTLLGFHAPFIPPERVSRLEADLAGQHGRAVHLRAGIMASRIVLPHKLRFCPNCAAEERAKFGEAYWHRLHQLAGVMVCPAHGMILEESPVDAVFRRTRHAFVPAEEVIQNAPGIPIEPQSPYHQTLLHIAQAADWLLKNYQPGTDLALLRERYIGRAMKLGFVTGTGHIHWQPLLDELHRRFQESFLRDLNSAVPKEAGHHRWLARILLKPRGVQAPIRHLILMELLGLTPATAFITEGAAAIFGPGPWPCDNPVCPQYGRNVIKHIQYEHSHEHRQPLGLLTCPACGQMTCRVAIHGRESIWVRDFGSVWKAALARLWGDPTISLRAMARQLGVDPMTVKRHAAHAGLPFPRLGKRITGKLRPPPVRQVVCRPQSQFLDWRGKWLALREQNPTDTTTELRRRLPACYIYLHRHDRAWLTSHSPKCQRFGNHRSSVDWAARDLHLAARIGRAKDALLQEPGRPKQVFVAALGRQLGALAWIQKHSDKLPLTRSGLKSAVESRVAFAQRRLVWIAQRLTTTNIAFKPWQLIRGAGLRPELLSCAPIRQTIETLSSGANCHDKHF